MKTYIIGRQNDCDVQIDAMTVSRRHAELTITNDRKYYLIDCAGGSGTYVAGETEWEEITQTFVGMSDTILFGRHQLTMNEIINAIETGKNVKMDDVVALPDNDLPSGHVRRDPETGEPITG